MYNKPKKGNKKISKEVVAVSEEKVSNIISHLVSEDDKKRRVTSSLALSILSSTVSPLHSELRYSRNIVFVLEQALCLENLYESLSVIVKCLVLLLKLRNNYGFFEPFMALFYASYQSEETENLGLYKAVKFKSVTTPLEDMHSSGLDWIESGANTLAKQVLTALKSATEDLVEMLSNVQRILPFVIYCLTFLDDPSSFTLDGLTKLGKIQAPYTNLEFSLINFKRPEMSDKFWHEDGSLYILDVFLTQTGLLKRCALIALRKNETLQKDTRFVQKVWECLQSPDEELASIALQYSATLPYEIPPGTSEMEKLMTPLLKNSDFNATNKLTKLLENDDQLAEFIRLGGAAKLVNLWRFAKSSWLYHRVVEQLIRSPTAREELEKAGLEEVAKKRMLNSRDQREREYWVLVLLVFGANIDDMLDDTTADQFRRSMLSGDTIYTLKFMPASTLALICTTHVEISVLFDAISKSVHESTYQTCLDLLISLLSHFLLLTSYPNKPAETNAILRKYPIVRNKNVMKTLPALHVMPSIGDKHKHEFAKRHFGDAWQKRTLLLAFLSLGNSSIQAYVVSKGLVGEIIQLLQKTEKPANHIGLVIRSLVGIALVSGREFVKHKGVEVFLDLLAKPSSDVSVKSCIIGTLWILIYFDGEVISPALFSKIKNALSAQKDLNDDMANQFVNIALAQLERMKEKDKKGEKVSSSKTKSDGQPVIHNVNDKVNGVFTRIFNEIYGRREEDQTKIENTYIDLFYFCIFLDLVLVTGEEGLLSKDVMLDVFWLGIAREHGSINAYAIGAFQFWVRNCPLAYKSNQPIDTKILALRASIFELARLEIREYFSCATSIISEYLPRSECELQNEGLPRKDGTRTSHKKKIVAIQKREIIVERKTKELNQLLSPSGCNLLNNLQEKLHFTNTKIQNVKEKIASLGGQLGTCNTIKMRILQKQNELEKLRQVISCPICLDRHKNTAFRPCNHSLCHKCATAILGNQVQTGNGRCPICRVDVESQYPIYLN